MHKIGAEKGITEVMDEKSLAWIDSLYYIATIPTGTTNKGLKLCV